MITPRVLAALLLTTTLALSACGNDDKTDVAAAPASDTPGSSSAYSLPAITANATDLSKEPKSAAGTGTVPATVQTKDLVVGTGAVAKAHDNVTVHYVGSLYSNGKVFDTSWDGPPVPFSLDGVVPGFAQGIEGMKIGGRRQIVIPSDLAYGPDGNPPVIPPNSVLIFIVDLKAIG